VPDFVPPNFKSVSAPVRSAPIAATRIISEWIESIVLRNWISWLLGCGGKRAAGAVEARQSLGKWLLQELPAVPLPPPRGTFLRLWDCTLRRMRLVVFCSTSIHFRLSQVRILENYFLYLSSVAWLYNTVQPSRVIESKTTHQTRAVAILLKT